MSFVAPLLVAALLMTPGEGPAAPAAVPTSSEGAAAAAGDAAAEQTPAEAALPWGLRCLQRHYAVQVVAEDRGWSVTLPDGVRAVWDDGRTKTLAQRLDNPDLEDTLALPYPTGGIEAVPAPGSDPGRIRHAGLFTAAYGPPGKVPLERVAIAGGSVRVHQRVAPALRRVAERLAALLSVDPTVRPFLRPLGGGFVHRRIAGTQRLSAHSWGIAVDINPHRGDYWRWQQRGGTLRWRNRVPAAVVAAFEAEGFVWGGRWYHFDTPHFEYRPELLDPACQPRQAATGG